MNPITRDRGASRKTTAFGPQRDQLSVTLTTANVRDKAWANAMDSQSTQVNMEGMGEIVGRETKSDSYAFFYKLRQRQTVDAANGVNEAALALGDPQWYLGTSAQG